MDHVAAVRRANPHTPASWARESNIHLTVKFLGEIRKSSVEQISLAAGKSSAGFASFSIEIGGTGAFPKRGVPKVLWIGVRDLSGQLSELHKQLELECARLGFPQEERLFHPHLTVARLRRPQGSRALAATHQGLAFAPLVFEVSELLVIRSELKTEGSRYTVLSRHSLAAPAARNN